MAVEIGRAADKPVSLTGFSTATSGATEGVATMPRIRTVKPELFDDPDIGRLSPLARWMFVGLFTQADRRGRLADEPERLKLRLLGFDGKANADRLLSELAKARMIVRYEVDGHRWIQVRSFEKHQRPHPNEADSTIPACSGPNVKLHDDYIPCREKDVPSKPDTGVLDTGTLESGSRSTALAVVTDRFDEWYPFYPPSPNNPGPFHARKAWKKRKPDAETQQRMIDAIRKQRTWPNMTREGGRYVPTPQKWIEEHRELAPDPPPEQFDNAATRREAANKQAADGALKILQEMRDAGQR